MKKILTVLCAASLLAMILLGCENQPTKEETKATKEPKTTESTTEATTEAETSEAIPEVDETHSKEEYRDGQGTLLFFVISTYDEEGRVISRTSYSPEGKKISTMKHKYSESGRQILGSWVLESTGEFSQVEYYYNNQNQKNREWRHTNASNTVTGSMSYYTYDEEGRVVMQEFYSAWTEVGDHNQPVYAFFEYDERGLNTKYSAYTDRNQTEKYMSRVQEFDEAGKVTKYTNYDGQDQVTYYVIYHYDGEDCTGMDVYNADGTLRSSVTNHLRTGK